MSSLLPELAFEVKHLGTVERGKFTHKPLTIFCGPNNTGKSWTLYSLYHFYEIVRFYAVDLRGTDDHLFPDYSILNDVVSENLPDFFNTADTQLQGARFNLIPSQVWEKDLEVAGEADIFLLPAERSGLNLLFRELSTRRTALLHHASRERIDVNDLLRDVIYSRYAKPIADYINWLNSLTEIQDSNVGDFHLHAERLKRGLAGGSYRVDPRTGSIEFSPYQPRRLRRRPARMGLHITSSAVKSLFGLWFYLEHQARAGNILMIDEPELNIHPANQRQIARLLARLVNAGIHVVISTHSDYIVREFNSLIMLHQHAAKALRRRYRYRDDELLDPAMVGAFLFDNQTIDEVSITPDDGIHATTFDEVITRMNTTNNDIFFSIRRANEAKGDS